MCQSRYRHKLHVLVLHVSVGYESTFVESESSLSQVQVLNQSSPSPSPKRAESDLSPSP